MTRPPEQLGRLVLLHDEIPTRPGHWTRHLEGSYAIAGELRDLSGLGCAARMRSDLAELLAGLGPVRRRLDPALPGLHHRPDALHAGHRRGRLKRAALEWAADRCDPEWPPLLTQAIGDRPQGWDRDQQPRPGSLERSLDFLAYAQRLASATPSGG